jgi:hypothetical protein
MLEKVKIFRRISPTGQCRIWSFVPQPLTGTHEKLAR